jgi:hypothetical protein
METQADHTEGRVFTSLARLITRFLRFLAAVQIVRTGTTRFDTQAGIDLAQVFSGLALHVLLVFFGGFGVSGKGESSNECFFLTVE